MRGTYPALLKDVDPRLVTTVQRTTARHTRQYLEYITTRKVNWCVLAVPIPAWAARVFPAVAGDEAVGCGTRSPRRAASTGPTRAPRGRRT